MLTWLTLASILSVWLALSFSDVTWWGTALAFAPRWLVGVPLVVLVPWSLIGRRWRLLVANCGSVVVVAFPLMGLEVERCGRDCPSQKGIDLRVLTCNVHGSAFDVAKLNQVIAKTGPDVVALQECPSTITDNCFADDDWFVKVSGELCVASRYPIISAQTLERRRIHGWGNFAFVCEIDTPGGQVAVGSIHFLSPRDGLEKLIARRFSEVRQAQEQFQVRHEESKLLYRKLTGLDGPMVLAGDFNLTPESHIFRKYLLQFSDAFSEAGCGFGYTRWTRWHGVRIDHVLADQEWEVECCRVCDDVGSDHLPIVAELRRVSPRVDETP